MAGNKSKITVKVNNIDRVKPTVNCPTIKNTNTDYPNYANRSNEINITVRLTENVSLKSVDLSKLKILVGDTTANATINWTEESFTAHEAIYNLKLTNIQGNGLLKLVFEEGFGIDTSGNLSEKQEISTRITIDNIKPTVTYSQNIIDKGKVNAKLTANEQIRQSNGWNISTDSKQLNKDFISNVSYEITIKDYAGNSTVITVNVTGATFITLIYASHNSDIGWTYGFGNYDIAGKQSVLTNSLYKTEALAFRVEGNISSDFIMGRAYVYSHWNGANARCADSGMIYNYGYNPSSSSWKTMNSSDLVTISGKKYFQFGGAGINGVSRTDINGNNPIPAEIANQFNYGMCGITLGLKDYTDYSIVYQIYVSEVGWLEAKANGAETIYSKTKPMSAFRVALIPTSEKQNQINTWNKDIGAKIK